MNCVPVSGHASVRLTVHRNFHCVISEIGMRHQGREARSAHAPHSDPPSHRGLENRLLQVTLPLQTVVNNEAEGAEIHMGIFEACVDVQLRSTSRMTSTIGARKACSFFGNEAKLISQITRPTGTKSATEHDVNEIS